MGHDLKVLLDTHALLWIVNDDPRLSKGARALFDDGTYSFVVSAVSAMEITTKVRIGKLPEGIELARDFAGSLSRLEVEPLGIGMHHAVLAGSMAIPHNDPFDRLLIAQARIERMPIVSNEKLFDGFGVERIW